MEIKLYHIDGISREDTFFPSLAQGFLDRYLVDTITYSFYPPHYRDRIKVELTSNENINYLSFEFQSVVYYYFIEDLEYVNESVVYLDIAIDTLMTYGQFTSVSYGIMERMHIERWKRNDNTYVINRDYIRENFSKGEFKPILHKEYIRADDWSVPVNPNDQSRGMICIMYDSVDNDAPPFVLREPINVEQSWKYGTEHSFYPLGFVPFVEFIKDSEHGKTAKDINNVSPDKEFMTMTSIVRATKDPKTMNMFYIPFNPIGDMYCAGAYIFYDSDILQCKNTNALAGSDIITIANNVVNPNQSLTTYWFKDRVDGLQKFRNTSRTTRYDKSYIPALLDNNYYKVSFGESANQATIDLYSCAESTFYAFHTASVVTGARFYLLSPTNYNYNDIKIEGSILLAPTPLDNYVICEKPITIPMFVDTWETWLARNQFTTDFALIDYGVKCFSAYSGNSTSLANRNNKLDFDKNTLTREYSMGMVSPDDYTRNLFRNRREREFQPKQSSPIPAGLSAVAADEWNSWAAPDGIKSAGSYFNDLFAKAFVPQLNIYECLDVEYVARQYYMYGYKVDIMIDTSDYPYLYEVVTAYSKRFYFNYLKFKEIDLSVSILCGKEMLEDLENRLLTGVRIWNYTWDIGFGVGYDNVEVSYI